MQNDLPIPFEQVEKNIIISLILCFVTFGIYGIFWQAHQMRVFNKLMGFEKYNFWKWFVLTIITFGLYHIYFEYVMGDDLVRIQRKYNKPTTTELPIICVGLSFLGLFWLADAIQQYELHKLYEKDGSSF